MSPTLDPRRADEPAINLFHPVYHSYTYPIGCRVGIERILPPTLDDLDEEELVDDFSEPPVWVERLSPLGVRIGDQVIRGKNYTDLTLKIYRLMFDLFQGISRFIDSTVQQVTGGEGAHFPFTSLAVDPDTLHRLIESDFESGETAYSNLMKLFSEGNLTPCVTTPFHVMLPLLKTDIEIRLCIRAALIVNWRLLRHCNEFLERNGEQGLSVVPFWLPECGYSAHVIDLLEDEFQTFCQKQKLNVAHLVVLLDNMQVAYDENDVLMKSWNLLDRDAPVNGKGNGRNRKHKALKVHDGVHGISIVFRDRTFSDWVIHANPSVKKLLDRTIAKVDSDINSQNVHYGWAHFEELEALTYSPRSIINFQQKLIKLTELGYLPLSPDFYVRGKLRGEFGLTSKEPLRIKMDKVNTGNGWDREDSGCLCRWMGLSKDENGQPVVDARPYVQLTEAGPVPHSGCAAWKVAWHQARTTLYDAIVGDLQALKGGMAAVLRELTGLEDDKAACANVLDFLAHYAYVYWRDHFIQHDMAEADINILETANKHLRAGKNEPLDATEAAIAGTAAQAIYFAIDSARSNGTGYENIDQRAFYQNVVMLTLAASNAIHVHHWQGDKRSGRKLLHLVQTELLDFETAFDRMNLAALGITQEQWTECIRSEIAESTDNVVRRAALRVAARNLRQLGYTKEFTRADANITTNVGHLWTQETGREFFAYENQFFCGVGEA